MHHVNTLGRSAQTSLGSVALNLMLCGDVCSGMHGRASESSVSLIKEAVTTFAAGSDRNAFHTAISCQGLVISIKDTMLIAAH